MNNIGSSFTVKTLQAEVDKLHKLNDQKIGRIRRLKKNIEELKALLESKAPAGPFFLVLKSPLVTYDQLELAENQAKDESLGNLDVPILVVKTISSVTSTIDTKVTH
jgi:hypothetical protein